jgi:hypothetical protein
MLDGLITGVFEVVVYGLGRLLVRIVTFGRYVPKEKDNWWVSLLGVGVTIGVVAVIVYVTN